MILAIADVLSEVEVAEVCARLSTARFVDGKATAGWSARLVKANLQATGSPELDRMRALVELRLTEHAVFALAVRPKTVLGPLFSRYEPGHAYGAHVDDALLAGVRADVSFTLFLSPPESYDGGELVIDSASGEDAFKLAPGSLVTYPSTTLHRVEKVTRGSRLVAVSWAQSYIRDPARRELLFDLDMARRSLFPKYGKTREFDAISKAVTNLLRMWADA